MNAFLLEQTKCSYLLYASEVEALVTPLFEQNSDLKVYKIQPLDKLIQPGTEHYLFDKDY